MRKIFFIYIFLNLLLFNTCTKKNNVSVIKSINFNTGLVDLNSSFIGTYFDKTEQKDIVYFLDKTQCIKRFYLTGEKLDSIPLLETIEFLKNQNDMIRIVAAYSNDTILVLSDYNNTILSINKSGKIFLVKYLDNILPDSLKSIGGIDNCFSSNSNSDYNNLFYTFYPKQEYYKKYYNNDSLGLYDKMVIDNKLEFELPYLINIKNLYTDSLKINFAIDDYAKKNYKQNEFIFRFNDFKIIEDKIFILPHDLDIISIYSIDNFEHLKDIKIKSNSTDIGFKPLTIKEAMKENNSHNIYGKIQHLFFSAIDKEYYVIVSHNQKDKISSYNNAFSIIKYDENFENNNEYIFSDDKYYCRKAYMTSKGIILQCKPINLTKNNYGTQTFDLLKFE